MAPEDPTAVLRRGLDQLTSLLSDLDEGVMDGATPCEQWRVRDLVDHIVAAPARFARMTRGEPVDWAAGTPASGDEPAASFRNNADELLRAWDAQAGDISPLDWQCAELAVHTWDLATALGRSTEGLDPEVADRGLSFMRANLTADRRGAAFGPEQPAPPAADPYARIAAFAGRRVPGI